LSKFSSGDARVFGPTIKLARWLGLRRAACSLSRKLVDFIRIEGDTCSFVARA
jgi:hypothetical protein